MRLKMARFLSVFFRISRTVVKERAGGGGGWGTWDQTLWEGEGRLAEKCVALMLKGPRGDKVK